MSAPARPGFDAHQRHPRRDRDRREPRRRVALLIDKQTEKDAYKIVCGHYIQIVTRSISPLTLGRPGEVPKLLRG
ncbi:MAG: hypothetical protein ACSLFF_08670 [Solirubrobacterales bacterium]